MKKKTVLILSLAFSLLWIHPANVDAASIRPPADIHAFAVCSADTGQPLSSEAIPEPDALETELSSPAATAPVSDTGNTPAAPPVESKGQSDIIDSEQGNIYANGVPLLIVATAPGYGKLYVDSNRDAQLNDGEEEITVLDPSYSYDSSNGFYLADTDIYGGYRDGNYTGNTFIALTGPYAGFQGIPENSSPKGTVWNLYGGCASGNLTGSTQVIIAGGKVGNWLFGGNQNASVEGNTSITMTNGIVAGSVCGGSCGGTVTGNSAVTISGGTVNNWIYGGGELKSSVTGSTQVTMTGGLVFGSICGGGRYGNVTGDTRVDVTGGTVDYDVLGGNCMGGAVEGDTYITLSGSAQINEYVFGGGAGYDPDEIVTVKGNTHVTLKDNAVIGIQGGGLLLGGGAERSIVEGKVYMEVNGGTVNTVKPGGNLWPGGAGTGTGDAFVTMTGGNVAHFANWGEDSGPESSLTLSVSGADFNKANIIIGCDTTDAALDNVSVTIDSCAISLLHFGSSITGNLSLSLRNAATDSLYLSSPVAGNVDISFQAAQAANFMMNKNVLNPAADSRLTFLECGSSTGKWGTLNPINITLTNTENPVLYGRTLYENKFKTLEIKDSYISLTGQNGQPDTSPASFTEKLIVDGGILRLCGLAEILMPETEFINSPLLMNSLNSSNLGSPIHFGSVPAGTARLKWLPYDGNMSTDITCIVSIAQAPSTAADTIFSSETDAYVLKTESFATSEGETGKSWQLGSLSSWCKCSVPNPAFEKYIFPMLKSQESFSIVLRDLYEGSPDFTASCPVAGHKDQTIDVVHALTDYTMTAASIGDGNLLTVSGTGRVDVTVTKSVNGKSVSGQVSFYFISPPSDTEYESVYQSTEDILLEFGIKDIDSALLDMTYSYVYNNTLHDYVFDCDKVLSEDAFVFILPEEYMNGLEKGEYDMEARISLKNGQIMDFSFTLSITDMRTPEGTPRLSTDSLTYGNALDTIVLSGDMSYKGSPVKGTFSLVSPDTVPEVPTDGIYSLAWTFTPEDSRIYLETSGTSPLVIAPRPVTLKWNGTETRTYDGTPSNVTASAGNLFGQDEITVIVNGGAGTDAGTHTASAVRLTGTKAGNYVLPSSTAVEYTISPAPGLAFVTMEGWTYSPDNAGRKEPVPISPTNGTEHVTFLYKPKSAPDTAYLSSLPSNAGEYTVKAVFAAAGNYAEATATADFVIARASKPANLPEEGSILPPSSNQADSLKDLSAPDGWKWKDENLELIPGGSVSAVLVYHDTTNYEQSEITILISKPAEIILSATDNEYIMGEDRSSTIKCTGALKELKEVLMDGRKVDPANYTLTEGSTILTFSGKYMDQLTVGIHLVTLTYNAGNAETVINVIDRRDANQGSDMDSNSDNPPSVSDSPGNENAEKETEVTLSKKRRAPATGQTEKETENGYGMWYIVSAAGMAAAVTGTLFIAVILPHRKKKFVDIL